MSGVSSSLCIHSMPQLQDFFYVLRFGYILVITTWFETVEDYGYVVILDIAQFIWLKNARNLSEAGPESFFI